MRGTDLEEVESLHCGVVQPHVLTQVQRRQAKGVEVGLVGEKFEETHHSSQAGHGHLLNDTAHTQRYWLNVTHVELLRSNSIYKAQYHKCNLCVHNRTAQ